MYCAAHQAIYGKSKSWKTQRIEADFTFLWLESWQVHKRADSTVWAERDEWRQKKSEAWVDWEILQQAKSVLAAQTGAVTTDGWHQEEQLLANA